jgi:hypothetical protein
VELCEIVHPMMENLGFPFMSVPMKVDVEIGKSWGRLYEFDYAQNRIKKSCKCGKDASCATCSGKGSYWIQIAA